MGLSKLPWTMSVSLIQIAYKKGIIDKKTYKNLYDLANELYGDKK